MSDRSEGADHPADGATLSGPDAVTMAPRAEGYAEAPAGSSLAAVVIGTSPAGYEILEELGRGGMGVVYRARQTGLQRVVALKMILGGGHASAADLQRFRTEAEAIARLQHPHIVQIYEVGEHHGLPFFSLEFCEGGGLDAKLAGTPLAARAAAGLVEQLAHAMQAAHDKGVLHRDLKPANILFAPVPSPGGKTDLGTPKIADFGLAKKLQEVGAATGQGLTQTGSIMGTPSYMAPEQAAGLNRDLGPACDIYALGAILYECLTGRPPFRAATSLDTVLQVLHEQPVPPTQLNAAISRDLETICLKCLRKEPSKRYASATALAEDLHRYQGGEAILARPVRKTERLWFWCRRNPALATVSALGLVALVAGTIVSLAFAIQASQTAADLANKEKEAKKALDDLVETDKQRRRFTRQSALLALEKGVRYWDDGDATLGALWLTRSLEMTQPQDADLARVIRSYLAHVPFFVHPLQAVLPHEQQVWQIVFSPDGERVVTASSDHTARLWNASTGQPIGPPLRHKDKVNAVVFSPDGQQLATAAADGTARLWDGRAGQSLDLVLNHDNPVATLAYSPDGTRLLTSDGPKVWIWNAADGKLLNVDGNVGYGEMIVNVRAIPDSDLAVVQTRAHLTLIDGKTGAPWMRLPPVSEGISRHMGLHCIAVSSDGRRVAAGGYAGAMGGLRLWNVTTGQPIGEARPHPGNIWAVAFSPDGKFLASACADGQIRLWDAQTGEGRPPAHGRGMTHRADVEWVVFAADNKTLLSASRDGSAALWDVDGQTPLGGRMHQGLVSRASMNPTGSLLATASLAGTGRLWRRAPCRLPGASLPFWSRPNVVQWGSRFTLDGARVLAGNPLNITRLTLWDVASGRQVLSLSGEERIQTVAMSPVRNEVIAGWTEATSGPFGVQLHKGMATVFDLVTGRPVGPTLVHGATMGPIACCQDGKTALTVATASTSSSSLEMIRWDIATGQRVAGPWALPVKFGSVADIEICPDGQTVLLYELFGQKILPWNLDQGRPAGQLLQTSRRDSLCVSDDGRLAAVLGNPFFKVDLRRLPAWDQPVHPWTFPVGVTAMQFAPGGRALLTARMDGRCALWDTTTFEPTGQFTLPMGYAEAVAFTPDSKRVLVCTSEKTARLWDVETAVPLGPELPIHGQMRPHIAFNKQGDHFLIQDDREVRLYPVLTAVDGKVERLVCWVQVLSGLELDAEGRLHVLSADSWRERSWRLQALGGPPR